MSGSLVVLTPNGRRQTVKVTPNTTILQVLEEACEKHGFKPELYNLKHHRKVLDVTLTIRFAGLPNNCLLELIEAEVTRTVKPVTVGVQTEDGNRVMDEFDSSMTIKEVLVKLCPKELSPNTVVIYLRNEIYGDELKTKTLKSLGITSGRAMLRLIHRSPEELKKQANVSAPLPSKPVEEKPYKRQFQKIEPEPRPQTILPQSAASVGNTHEDNIQPNNSRVSDDSISESNKPAKFVKNDNIIFDKIRQEKRKQTDGLKIKSQPAHAQPAQGNDHHQGGRDLNKEDFIFLGERNAMLFSFETAQSLSNEDLPDDFYELSINDVKKLFRDIKKRRIEMEGGPLMTSAMRDMIENRKQLNVLNHYKKAVIRVQFPNRMVLQGVFKPSETVQDVQEFVKEYMADKKLDFYLFTTPPKTVLHTTINLLEADCVPGALLHFGCEEKRDNYLRSDILDKVASNLSAAKAASKARMDNMRVHYDMGQEDDIDISEYLQPEKDAPAASPIDDSEYKTVSRSPASTEKLPKWFKPSK